MTGLRPIIEAAVADAIAEHPKYFTPRGVEHAQKAIVRKIMSAMRGDAGAASDAAPSTSPSESQPIIVDPKSREGRGYVAFRQLSGAAAPVRLGTGSYSIPPTAQKESVYAFADLPPDGGWKFVTDHRAIGAWQEFFRETLPHAPKKIITQQRAGVTGLWMPWPWPPKVDGTTYSEEPAQ